MQPATNGYMTVRCFTPFGQTQTRVLGTLNCTHSVDKDVDNYEHFSQAPDFQLGYSIV